VAGFHDAVVDSMAMQARRGASNPELAEVA
jgi:hypothetical protein